MGKNLCRRCGPNKHSGYVCCECVVALLDNVEKRLDKKIEELEANYYLIRRATPCGT